MDSPLVLTSACWSESDQHSRSLWAAWKRLHLRCLYDSLMAFVSLCSCHFGFPPFNISLWVLGACWAIVRPHEGLCSVARNGRSPAECPYSGSFPLTSPPPIFSFRYPAEMCRSRTRMKERCQNWEMRVVMLWRHRVAQWYHQDFRFLILHTDVSALTLVSGLKWKNVMIWSLVSRNM